jgi:DNA replication and repair protein RecF
MSLVVTRLRMHGFRSYSDYVLVPDPHLTVLVGANAVGKTNIIEALQLLTAGESFRKPQWGEVTQWGEDEASLSLRAEGDGRVLEIDLSVGSSGRREYQVNGKKRRRVSEIAGILPCVLFTPDDLRIVKESAERRRSALDSLGVQLSPSYRSLKTEYERTLKQRNSLLRDSSFDQDVFHSLTERAVSLGAGFMASRIRLFNRVNLKMSDLYETLSGGERLTTRYLPSWGDRGDAFSEDEISGLLQAVATNRQQEEIARGKTLFGPHRDDLVFSIEDRDARAFSSQGQQRTVALAWKLAEVGVITEISGQPPLLLLDDVMSELDESRRHSLASFVGGAAQTVITTTNIGYFDAGLIERAKVVSLG